MNRRRKHVCRLAEIGIMSVLLVGCAASTVEIGPIDKPDARVPPSVMDWSDWGLTLSQVGVGERVDYDRLLKDRQPLDRFLSLASHVGPETTPDLFPDRNDQLAYALNCYNATILRSVVELAGNGKLPRHVPFGLERRLRFRIDGRLQSPADIRRSVETLIGDDWRVRLGLCDASQTGPPLPRHVFLGDLLDGQLNRLTRSALLSPQVVRIDHGECKRLLVWRGLYEIRDELVKAYEERLNTKNAYLLNVLLEWSDRPRRELLNSAVGYEVALMPASNRLNALEPAPEEERNIFSVLKSIKSFSFIRPE